MSDHTNITQLAKLQIKQACTFTALALSLGVLSACSTIGATGKAVGTVASLPFKAVYKTGEVAGKTVYNTGKVAGKGVYYTGKGLYMTGKGAYHVAKVPVKMTNAALDTSVKVLTITTQMVDLSGKVVEVSRNVQRAEVDSYVNKARSATNVLGILIDVARALP